MTSHRLPVPGLFSCIIELIVVEEIFVVFYVYRSKMKRVNILFSILIIVSLLSACATAPEQKPSDMIKPSIPLEEQKTLAMAKFNDILTLRESTHNRDAIRPELENLYLDLVTEYPDAPLAQESYWKLIEMYLKEYSPPEYDRAEELYGRFVQLYPEPGMMKIMIDRSLGIMYYKNREWERLLKLTAPLFRAYVDEDKRTAPFLLFSYAESNFQLRNFDDAEQGFKVVLKDFPDFSENRLSKARVTYIQRKR
jgi:tetratricopeptide (TPR) repeat protein